MFECLFLFSSDSPQASAPPNVDKAMPTFYLAT